MSALAAIALQAGLPIVEKLLSKKIGDQGGALATAVIAAIAGRAGVMPEEVEALAENTPGRVIDAMREVERASPDLLGCLMPRARMVTAGRPRGCSNIPTGLSAARPPLR